MNKKVDWSEELSPDEWLALFVQAEAHHVLPLIFEAVCGCAAAGRASEALFVRFRQRTVSQVVQQTVRTHDFLRLNEALRARGLRPLAVKGIICRALYPNPDCRPSGDEDVLIGREAFEACSRAMCEAGMESAGSASEASDSYEVPYRKPGSPLYIELHKELFSSDSEAYGDLNRFFEDALDNGVELEIQGTPVLTMEPTQHLLYLICHAFKHFMHSGFGIRQICDIALFARHYGESLRWDYLMDCCREIHAEYFALALFRIGRIRLGVDIELPAAWETMPESEVDELPLLEDVLAGGIYGSSSRGRLHSSTVTLDAVSADKRGRRATPLLKSLFPSAKYLAGRYPYLKRYPALLPLAWAQRVLHYRREMAAAKTGRSSSLEIGKARVALMRAYRIIR